MSRLSPPERKHRRRGSDREGRLLGRQRRRPAGDGTTTDSSVPVAVSGITNATAVAVGGDPIPTSDDEFACALLSTGGVDCWGYNNVGQLGDGTITDSSVPVAVSGITDATAITAGDDDACALLSTGGLTAGAPPTSGCWGTGT